MTTERTPLVTVEMVTELSANDISELCDATEEAIEAGVDLAGLPRLLARYWKITGVAFCLFLIIIYLWASWIM